MIKIVLKRVLKVKRMQLETLSLEGNCINR